MPGGRQQRRVHQEEEDKDEPFLHLCFPSYIFIFDNPHSHLPSPAQIVIAAAVGVYGVLYLSIRGELEFHEEEENELPQRSEVE